MEELEKQLEIISSSHPKLRYCEWFDEKDSLWDFSRHSHPYLELIHYVKGKGYS